MDAQGCLRAREKIVEWVWARNSFGSTLSYGINIKDARLVQPRACLPMCRIASYIGSSIPLQNIVTAPRHSLLSQSRDAIESKVNLNGDGFGMAWYAPDSGNPGLYRECSPAWSDENLVSLCRIVKSPLFIAHVRASTMGTTMRAN